MNYISILLFYIEKNEGEIDIFPTNKTDHQQQTHQQKKCNCRLKFDDFKQNEDQRKKGNQVSKNK